MTMPTDVDQDDKKQSQALVDYLQAPRKKRKNYVIVALGDMFDREIGSGIEVFVRKNFNQLAVVSPKNEKELRRLFSRQIVLLVIDDNFKPLEETIDIVVSLKQKKMAVPAPVLFLTDNAEELIRVYHRDLLAFQEVDNYVNYRSMPLAQINARVQAALNIGDSRRSRRFDVKVPVSYLHLSRNELLKGEITDISLHGCVIVAGDDTVFKTSDQFKLHIPTFGLLPPTVGDFFRMSGKVRRVFMGGNKAGLSWEHASEEQSMLLMRFITELVNQDMFVRARRTSG